MQPVGAIDLLYQPVAGACSAPEAALAEMDEAGVAVAFVAPCTQLTCERQWACVDSRLEDVSRFMSASVRFAGLCGFNPFDAAESFREMESARGLGFRGVSVTLSAFGLALGDARYYPLFAKASELQFPAVVQCSPAEPAERRALRRIARDFSELSLAIVVPCISRELSDVIAEFDRLAFILDTASLAMLCDRNADWLDQASLTERCMWGSNGAPLQASVERFLELPLPQAASSAILRDNALRYFATTPPVRLPRSLDACITAAER